MAYLKINDVDYSKYVNKLSIQTNHLYNARVNSVGTKYVKYINSKKVITVGIIALSGEVAAAIQAAVNQFSVSVSYRDPETQELVTKSCIVPKNTLEYYTVQAGNVLTKAFILTFEEL